MHEEKLTISQSVIYIVVPWIRSAP